MGAFRSSTPQIKLIIKKQQDILHKSETIHPKLAPWEAHAVLRLSHISRYPNMESRKIQYLTGKVKVSTIFSRQVSKSRNTKVTNVKITT